MNKKNWLLLILVCSIAITSFSSCKKSKDEDQPDAGPTEWTKGPVFTNAPRSGAASFTINNVAYVVGGHVQSKNAVNDGLSFDGESWDSIDDFPGTARHSAVGVAVNGIGYVGLGSDTKNSLKDFYKFDPKKEKGQQWSKVDAEFPGVARYGAVAFALGNNIYVGLGRANTNENFSDFYKYDPATNAWTQIKTKFKSKKAFAFAFVIDNKAYVGGGQENSSNLPEDFYSFDGTNWTELPDLKRDEGNATYDARKHSAATFVIGKYAYVVGGRSGLSITNSVWKFDPSTNLWTDEHQKIPTDTREKAVGFAIDGKGYLTTGVNSSFIFENTYVFTPVR